MKSKTFLVEKDFTKQFNDAVKRFEKDSVLIGIPEDADGREADGTEEIGNAALLAILNFGSPLNNIPAWNVMGIGIRSAQDAIAKEFEKAAKNTLTKAVKGQAGGFSDLANYYERAGIIASTAVKTTINSQEDAPALAESTLMARKSMGFKGTSRGIVTGQMRNAITYVIRGKE